MVGIDIVAINRIEKFYDKFGQKALKRYLRDEEIALVNSSMQTAAGFWAAKEAVSKALGCGISDKCSFHDIWIHKNSLNAPFITLSKRIIDEFKIIDTSVSIAHDNGFAIAAATLTCKNDCIKTLHH